MIDEDMKRKPDDELREELVSSREELFNLRFQSSTEQIESPARIRELRRGIARMETLLRERQLGIRGAEPQGK